MRHLPVFQLHAQIDTVTFGVTVGVMGVVVPSGSLLTIVHAKIDDDVQISNPSCLFQVPAIRDRSQIRSLRTSNQICMHITPTFVQTREAGLCARGMKIPKVKHQLSILYPFWANALWSVGFSLRQLDQASCIGRESAIIHSCMRAV